MSCPNTLNPGRMEGSIAAALSTGILFVQCIYVGMKVNKTPMRIAMFAQFVLVTARQITVTIATAAPTQNCYANTVIGLLFYHCWVPLLQYVIYLRTKAFIISDLPSKIFMGVCLSSFVTQLIIRFYQIGNVAVTSTIYCSYITGGTNVGLANFGLLTGTLLFMILPFFYQMYTVFYGEKIENTSWWRTIFLNFFAVSSIIVIEFVARDLTNRGAVGAYTGLMFSCINTYEANVVLLLMDDFRATLTSSQTKTKTANLTSGVSSTSRVETKPSPSS
ncbi:hypothetical protein HDV03_001451 [Kappamyces sp. JEL0829]|nr:hypothetical protein HDV03_001451 [Kappamyces sp. JEL0829]